MKICALVLIFAMTAAALPAETPPRGSPPKPPVAASKPERADRLLVEKAARKMTLFAGSETLRSYRIALGRQPVGDKQCQGDCRTPEGFYVIDSRNPKSQYHRSLHVSYPSPADVADANKRGCAPGGAICIHGLPNGFGYLGPVHTLSDWTLGCIAVTDQEIEEIWKLVPNGTPIEIRP